jgi:hypothetical protein
MVIVAHLNTMPLDSMPKSVIMTEPSQNLFICSKFSEQKVYKRVGNPISSTIIITDILHKHEKREYFFPKVSYYLLVIHEILPAL